MAWQGLFGKAGPTVVTGVVGVATYEAVAKAPWRRATVTAMAWGVRGLRKAEVSAERARLAAADMLAEAVERSGEEMAPSAVAQDKVQYQAAETETADAGH